MGQLSDKVAIVTGASRGIGAAAAIELARQGAKVSLSARTAAACNDTLQQISDLGGDAFAASCDVSDVGAVDKLVEDTLARFGRIDILVNNAGIIDPIGRITETDPEDWMRNISVNLAGVYHGTRAVLPHFEAQKSGIIINISSGAAHGPMEGWSAYCSGKAAVHMMTRAAAHESGELGVRVYGFAPGVVDTEMQSVIRGSGINPVSEIPRENLAPADDPAKVIAWLCTDEAADLAGEELTIRDETLRKRAGLPAA